MEYFVKVAQAAVALSVVYVWTFRFHNVIKEFKEFGISDLTRSFVGASKIALSTPSNSWNLASFIGSYILYSYGFFNDKRSILSFQCKKPIQ